jgi:transcriptional regulator with XRE-family HTH domain
LRPEHQKIADQAVGRFAERVRELRADRGWSQERLAEEADLHRTYIGGIERGLRNVSLFNIAKLAHAFSVPIAALFMNDKKLAA